MFSTFPYKAIKYQFSSDLPLITLTGIGFQNITDHSYSWHNLHRHDKHCLIQYCISGQGILTINNSTYTITAGKVFKNLKGITLNTFRKQSIHYDTLQTIYDFSATKKNTLM